MENADQGKGEHDCERPEEVGRKKSVEDIARQLEDGSLSVDLIDGKTIRACIRYFAIRKGYSSLTIAEILKISVRTVQRMMRKIRNENVMNMSMSWQKNLIGDFISQSRAQVQRLSRLLQSGKLSPAEILRITMAQNEIQLRYLLTLERNGYFWKFRGFNDVSHEIDERKKREEAERNYLNMLEEELEGIGKQLDDVINFKGPEEEMKKLFKSLKESEEETIRAIRLSEERLRRLQRERLDDEDKYIKN